MPKITSPTGRTLGVDHTTMDQSMLRVPKIAEEKKPCPICELVKDGSTVVQSWPEVVALQVEPYVPGHMVIVPIQHVADITVRPYTAEKVTQATAWLAKRIDAPLLIVTTVGDLGAWDAGHYNVHLFPRSDGDIFRMPWEPVMVTRPYLDASPEEVASAAQFGAEIRNLLEEGVRFVDEVNEPPYGYDPQTGEPKTHPGGLNLTINVGPVQQL